jgi:hypothetical protein
MIEDSFPEDYTYLYNNSPLEHHVVKRSLAWAAAMTIRELRELREKQTTQEGGLSADDRKQVSALSSSLKRLFAELKMNGEQKKAPTNFL